MQPATSAPRPYLHPVLSLRGVALTEAEPVDHPHHLGLSLAFSDLNGTNFWGGSTFTAGDGPVLLPNHGTQVPWDWQCSEGGAAGNVTWRSETGTELAVERRSFHCLAHPEPGTWSLSLTSVMVPGRDPDHLVVSSSAVKGRKGAGYGGIFWRFVRGGGDPLILSAAGAGEAAAHGSQSPWLSMMMRIGGSPVSVILAQEPARLLPWFIRADAYLGAGPAVAWAEPARADRAHPLKLSLHAVIHDGPVTTADRALELLQQHSRLNRPSSLDRTT
jgi:LacI family transcriptional regulator